MKRIGTLPIVFLLASLLPSACVPGAFAAAKGGRASGGTKHNSTKAGNKVGSWPRAVPMFDKLEPKPAVIYLLNNSSFVWGPDAHGLSEEITFTGVVTVPKWPMPGYQRRVLPDGRQQIDIELTDSTLVGESYLLGGQVKLGEHPALRSLGTITEPGPSAVKAGSTPAGAAMVKASYSATEKPAKGTLVAFRITSDMAAVISANPNIDWDGLVAAELRRLIPNISKIKDGTLPAEVATPPTSVFVQRQFDLPAEMAAAINASPTIDWTDYVNSALQRIVDSLKSKNRLAESKVNNMPLVIPSDFIVARKVLINTAKGMLYNETAVPVKGKLDAIPPVRTKETASGINVFKGMELPVALLDKDGNVDGWFYSKAHTAMSVKPDAIERSSAKATLEVRSGDKVERVEVSGPAEVHWDATKLDANGLRETGVEVVVLAMRGHSELLGGNVMVIEQYDPEKYFSRGKISWKDAVSGNMDFDLWVGIDTPAGVLTNHDAIPMTGKVTSFWSDGALKKGPLNIPLVGINGNYASSSGGALYNDADQLVANIDSIEVQFSKGALPINTNGTHIARSGKPLGKHSRAINTRAAR